MRENALQDKKNLGNRMRGLYEKYERKKLRAKYEHYLIREEFGKSISNRKAEAEGSERPRRFEAGGRTRCSKEASWCGPLASRTRDG
jgi:hypothetical protein